MKLLRKTGGKNIKVVIETHPTIGEIPYSHEIGCNRCTVWTCLLQDAVAVHFLGDDAEAQIEQERNKYLERF